MTQYEVQFSEEDLFHIEGNYCRMHGNIVPTPDIGQFVVKSDGIYEIGGTSFSLDNHFDVYLRPVLTETQDGDIIVVHSKERYYRCYNKDQKYGFKKVTLLTLMNSIADLETRLVQMQKNMKYLIQ